MQSLPEPDRGQAVDGGGVTDAELAVYLEQLRLESKQLRTTWERENRERMLEQVMRDNAVQIIKALQRG